jgi:aminoglycoside phosphotransferase (APT) family kinase protein
MSDTSNYKYVISLQSRLQELNNESFERVSTGTRNIVYSSENYIIRFRKDTSGLIVREADFLKEIPNSLIPKVIWSGEIDSLQIMVERRLPGNPVDGMWQSMSTDSKQNLINDVVIFLSSLRNYRRDICYSVQTGKKYDSFASCLLDGLNNKIDRIRKSAGGKRLVSEQLFDVISNDLGTTIDPSEITVVHGDLIIHNLLTDGHSLTGVIDWEFALAGDPAYDLYRLEYYRECSMAYNEPDASYEKDYMDKLMEKIKVSNLVPNIKVFNERYAVIKKIYQINAAYWAATSTDPETNLSELSAI